LTRIEHLVESTEETLDNNMNSGGGGGGGGGYSDYSVLFLF
jgi:hypothetical protein